MCGEMVLTKRIAKALISKYPDSFTDDFEKNKQIINQLLTVDSKTIKYQVAGLVTRTMKKELSKN